MFHLNLSLSVQKVKDAKKQSSKHSYRCSSLLLMELSHQLSIIITPLYVLLVLTL